MLRAPLRGIAALLEASAVELRVGCRVRETCMCCMWVKHMAWECRRSSAAFATHAEVCDLISIGLFLVVARMRSVPGLAPCSRATRLERLCRRNPKKVMTGLARCIPYTCGGTRQTRCE